MEYLLWLVCFTILAYVIADKVSNKFPSLDIDARNYAIGSFVIGIPWCMIFLAYKVFAHQKYGKYTK